MNKLIKYFLQKKSVTILLLTLILLGGAFAYVKMGKLEDAPFTIKQALVITPYPGASPQEVQTQVTDVLEESIQSLGELYYLKTENRAGISKITVYVKKEIRADEMQQLWDKLRRKVSDVQSKLPAGAGTSVVNDDFGDVLGVFYGLTGEGQTYRELEDQAKLLKNTLLKVTDVSKVEIYGMQVPTIDVAVSPAVMSRSGITTADIARAFEAQNKVVDAGSIETKESRIRIESTGNFFSLEDIGNLTIVSRTTNEHFRLADIAQISEGYRTPASSLMRMNGEPAVGIAISTVPTGNVVDMARLVQTEVERFAAAMPEGYTVSPIYDQGYESDVANQGFILNLIISVITVVAILLFFIGLKNGLLVGSGLIFAIFATLIVMLVEGIALQRMSLAAIIIAMGMLVDNAIVVSDSALVNMQRGMRKRIAILRACSSTALPLLAATVIAILTFLPIYYSPHITGELLSSLVIVIGVSLMFSWVFALTQTTFFIQEFVRRPRPDELQAELFAGKYFDKFRGMLRFVIRHRYAAVGTMVLLMALSAWSFKFIPKVFVPSLDKQYFTIDTWMPEGTRIEETDRITAGMADYIRSFKEVEMVTTYAGRTPPRYYLSNVAFGPQPNYAQLLVKCHSSKESRALHALLLEEIPARYPELFTKVNKFELSPLTEAMIEARFLGPDADVLDSLAGAAIEIMRRNPKAADARNEWGNRTLMIRPVYDPVKAGALGITKAAMMESVKSIGEGTAVGVYRDEERGVPVLLKSSGTDITDAAALGDFPVWNGEHSAPLSQVTERIETVWEFPQIRTYNRQLSMAAMCGVKPGYTMGEVHSEIREEIEAMKLPAGYTFFWDSQYKDQSESLAAIAKYFPLAFLLLVVILVALFGNFREPVIILCVLPLSLIGVAVGMLLTGFEFGFFPIAGWLGLLGMIIKNVIVLIDEINVQHRSGIHLYTSIIEATVTRTRPVLMAATTTILGMVPLLFDVAFCGMAATIIFGLTFATALTLFITPALYAIFYQVGSPQSSTERHEGKAGKKGWKKWLGKRKRKSSVKLGVLCVAFFCIPTALQAQSSPLLERYRSMALAYSHDLKAAEKNISASLELEKSARADLKPKLSAEGQFNYTGKPMKLSLDLPALESPLNFGGQNLGYGASVSLLQPLYTGGMLLESIKMAQHQQSLAKNQQEMIQAMICYQVDIQYWNTVARRELVSVATAFRHSIASLVRTIKERVDAGLTDPQDLLMAEVKLNDAEYQLLQAQNNLETGRMALNSLIGEALSADTEIETRLPAVCAEEAAAPGNAGSRPELRMADDRIRLAESSCKLNDAKFRPQFYIGIDGSCSSPGYNFNKDLDPNYAVYAKVSVPLWEWGKRKSVKRASTFKVGMAQDNRRRVEDDLTLEVQTARLSLAQSAERIRLSQNSLEKADENERQALERYTEGRTSLIDVIEAQTYRQQAQQLSVQARAGGQSDAAALTKALNGYGRVIEKL